MSEEKKDTKEPVKEVKEKKSNKLGLIVAFLSIIVIIQGVKIYLDYQKGKDKDATIEIQESEIQETKARLDQISLELDEKITEIERLGGDVEELKQAKEEIEKERDQLQRTRRANKRVIADLKAKADGYEELLKAKDEELTKLKEVNEELLTENTDLKTVQNQLSDSLSELTEDKEKLQSKVDIASRLKAENIGVFAISSKGKEKPSPFKKKQISKLKVNFNIAKNDVAPIEGKDIMIRIIDNNGQVLFDVANGSGTFMLGGREEFFTASQEVLFDNSNQMVTFQYDKGSEYEPGDYVMEIYAEDYPMGQTEFTVK